MKIRCCGGSGLWLRVLTFFLGISIVFRCAPLLIYRRSELEYGIILGLSLLTMHRYTLFPRLAWFEIFILLYPAFFLTSSELSKYMVFTVVGIYYYFRVQSDYTAFDVIRTPIVLFGAFTSLVTWISYFFPSFYTENILSFFENQKELVYQFSRRNMYMGFTNHYSRNAFYILIAAQFLFAEIICGKRSLRKVRWMIFLFLCVTELLVAKRGPLLYLIVSLAFTAAWRQKGGYGKIRRLAECLSVMLIAGILAVLFVPGADHIVNRMAESAQTGDITTGRVELYRIGIRMFLEHPLLGAGWDGFRQLMSGTTDQGVHNDYIQLLGELGIVGFAIVLAANVGILIDTLKAYRYYCGDCRQRTREQILLTFSLAYQVFVLVDSLTGLPHFSYEIYTLYLMAGGCGVGLYRTAVRESEKSGEDPLQERLVS